jgi:nucleotide-binding universal stress UspA family protein
MIEEHMNKKKILVAASLTRGLDAAFNRGLSLARESDAELYVLHAVPANEGFSRTAAERLEIRRELQERAERAGVTMTAVEQQGDPAEIIELHATARDADLIVMGADRTSRLGWWRWPSVAERVLRRATRPTLVVSSDDDAGSGYANVLVAADLSRASKVLVQQALQLATPDSPRFTLVHAVNGIESAAAVQSAARWKVPEYRTHVFDAARRRFDALMADFPAIVDARLEMTTDSVPRAIVDGADTIDADLIVVGSTRRFKPFGSTAQRVLADGRRALLVIPLADTLRNEELTEGQRVAA